MKAQRHRDPTPPGTAASSCAAVAGRDEAGYGLRVIIDNVATFLLRLDVIIVMPSMASGGAGGSASTVADCRLSWKILDS